jgi:hypothetical protein
MIGLDFSEERISRSTASMRRGKLCCDVSYGAGRWRRPAVYSYPFFAEASSRMSYGIDVDDLHRCAG